MLERNGMTCCILVYPQSSRVMKMTMSRDEKYGPELYLRNVRLLSFPRDR